MVYNQIVYLKQHFKLLFHMYIIISRRAYRKWRVRRVDVAIRLRLDPN